jgi:hypothetical protein
MKPALFSSVESDRAVWSSTRLNSTQLDKKPKCSELLKPVELSW